MVLDDEEDWQTKRLFFLLTTFTRDRTDMTWKTFEFSANFNSSSHPDIIMTVTYSGKWTELKDRFLQD